MNKTTTNLILLLGIIATIFGAYFFLSQDSTSLVSSSTSDAQLQQLLVSSQLFVSRSAALQDITMDTSVFESPEFNSLKTFSPPAEEFPIGRTNPFAPVSPLN